MLAADDRCRFRVKSFFFAIAENSFRIVSGSSVQLSSVGIMVKISIKSNHYHASSCMLFGDALLAHPYQILYAQRLLFFFDFLAVFCAAIVVPLWFGPSCIFFTLMRSNILFVSLIERKFCNVAGIVVFFSSIGKILVVFFFCHMHASFSF